MKRTALILLIALTVAGLHRAEAQGLRVGDRAWYAIRGGLFIGANQTFHNGDVPMLPIDGNTYFAGSSSSTNFIFGIHGEKAVSRFVVFGLRAMFDQMSGDMEGTFKYPFRLADEQGVVYDVAGAQKAEYTLQYLSFGLYSKLYLMRGPGFFVTAGGSVSTLIKNSYSNSASLIEPAWAKGSNGTTQTGGIENVNNMRYSADVGIGYDFSFRYGFITPIVEYEFGLNKVADASYAGNWKVDNLRFLLEMTFPVP